MALGAVALMSLDGKEETTDFQGIADAREVIVNSENAVEIKKFHVIPGQEVNADDLLVELDQPELNMKINEISHELEEFKNRRVLNVEEHKSRIRQLEAEKASVVNEINYKIMQLESRQDFNKKITSGLKSIQPVHNSGETKKSGKTGAAGSPIALEIERLKKERALALNRITIEMERLQAELEAPESPVTIRVQSLEKELKMLEKKKEKLLIFSLIDGVIGSIHFKPGEKASPFVPILTLYTKTPSYVKGYIHENLYNRISLGEKVSVKSGSGKNCCAEGEVVGIGSRIIEYPQRLRKRPEIQMWGREVQIRIPEDNSFLLGEKVMVFAVEHRKPSYWARLKDLWSLGLAYTKSIISKYPV
jgi:multidrug resistance efflux pump